MSEQAESDEAELDWDSARRQAPRKSRAVVSVAFSRYDFERLSRHVERLGATLSEYIRTAALASIRADEVARAARVSAGTYYAPPPIVAIDTKVTPTHAEHDRLKVEDLKIA